MEDSIIIYSSPSCPQCRMIKMQLNAKGIEYNEIQDVSTLKSMNISKIPTLKVNNDFFVGAQKIMSWIKEKKDEK